MGLDDGLFSQAVTEVSKFDFTKTKTSDLASIFELPELLSQLTNSPKKGNCICRVPCTTALTNMLLFLLEFILGIVRSACGGKLNLKYKLKCWWGVAKVFFFFIFFIFFHFLHFSQLFRVRSIPGRLHSICYSHYCDNHNPTLRISFPLILFQSHFRHIIPTLGMLFPLFSVSHYHYSRIVPSHAESSLVYSERSLPPQFDGVCTRRAQRESKFLTEYWILNPQAFGRSDFPILRLSGFLDSCLHSNEKI